MASLTPDQISIVNKTREACQGRATFSLLQELTSTEVEAEWDSPVISSTFHKQYTGENNISEIIHNTIQDLGTGSEIFEKIPVGNVAFRWTGYQPVHDGTKPPTSFASEEEKYNEIMKDVIHPVTILYFHGGGFWYVFYCHGVPKLTSHSINTPSRYQSTTTKLVQLTGGCCVTFRYRLSPQNVFPAALVDALFAYISLISPGEDSFLDPVPASSIVFAGDSAGANLALSLIQVLLSARNRGEKIQFNGKFEELPLPAGVALLSPDLDLTYALTSKENLKYDIWDGDWSFQKPDFPSCPLWPSNPPRCHVYADKSMMCHPLVSPCLAKSWKDSPPMWIAGGQEVMTGAARLAVQNIARAGGRVSYEEYEGMPHDFPIMSENWPWATTGEWPQSIRCMETWARACWDFAEGKMGLQSRAILVGVDKEEEPLDPEKLSAFSLDRANEMMEEEVEGWKPWTGTQL